MSQEKQFEATASRMEKAKREGDVARSSELSGVAAFGAGLAAVAAIVHPLGDATAAAFQSAASGHSGAAGAVQTCAFIALPLASASFAACAVHVAQGGLQFVPISLKVERLNPAENFKRMFSRESVITAVRASVAFACAAAAVAPAFAGICRAALHSGSVASIGAAAWGGALHTSAAACAVGAAFAAADYGVQLARWRRKLRMSHEEIKRDQKEHDGDPLAKNRRRALHRQIARGSMQRIKEAAFVVTNPTHVAIALAYRPPEVPVPRVLIRAADEAAAQVRELAAKHAVPLVENVALARTLYAMARPGDYIPAETYVAVAEIVAALTRSGDFGL